VVSNKSKPGVPAKRMKDVVITITKNAKLHGMEQDKVLDVSCEKESNSNPIDAFDVKQTGGSIRI
jgi:hypothetical protein